MSLLAAFIVGVVVAALLFSPHPGSISTPPARSDIRVTVSDGYLARRVQRAAHRLSVPTVSKVRITSHPPRTLVAGANVSAGPVTVPTTLEMQPSPAANGVAIRIVGAQVGGIPVPTFLTGSVQDAINSSTRRLLGPNARVTAVAVVSGGVEIWADYP